jgi:hypothetical protein
MGDDKNDDAVVAEFYNKKLVAVVYIDAHNNHDGSPFYHADALEHLKNYQ